MTEQELEQQLMPHGTAKRKSDLLSETGVSPLKMAAVVKRFGEPVPTELEGVESYVGELFDYLLDTEAEFFGKFQENKLHLDLFRYVCGEVWNKKHKQRSIINPLCAVTMDVRKCFKDAISAQAQTLGHLLKHSTNEQLTSMDTGALRLMLIEATEEALEESLFKPLLGLWNNGGQSGAPPAITSAQ